MNKNAVYIAIGSLIASISAPSHAQAEKSEEQIAIEKLGFLTGNWEGEGKSYAADGSVSPYFDTEDVWFDVQNSLLIIQAAGYRNDEQTYGLHTIVYYDKEAGHYWYNPYSATGAGSFSCELENKEFKCLTAAKTYRLTFRRTENGAWNEFGERLVDGEWKKNFETILTPAKDLKNRSRSTKPTAQQ